MFYNRIIYLMYHNVSFYGGENLMEIISVNITKGGCGKTTTVQMLGEILGKKYEKRILCIDTDPQCNLTTVSGIDVAECQEHNLYTLLKGQSSLQDCIVKSTYYDLIPSSILLAYADTEFNHLGREYMLKECIEDAGYDIILIDTPPALGLLNIMSLSASTKIIIPTECSYLAMIGLEQLSNTIESVRKHSNKRLEILGILLIKYNSRANINNAVLRGLEKMAEKMDIKVFKNKIRETVKVKEAQSQQEPLIDWDISCSAVQDYLEFTEEVKEDL